MHSNHLSHAITSSVILLVSAPLKLLCLSCFNCLRISYFLLAKVLLRRCFYLSKLAELRYISTSRVIVGHRLFYISARLALFMPLRPLPKRLSFSILSRLARTIVFYLNQQLRSRCSAEDDPQKTTHSSPLSPPAALLSCGPFETAGK